MPASPALLLYDLAFDFYGSRLATSSSDQRIRILEPDETAGGGWRAVLEFATGAPTLRLAWAHPSQGAILAGACLDGSVAIWEETSAVSSSSSPTTSSPSASASSWQQRALLGDARGRATAVAFAPRHLALRLAAGSSDGHVRVYEAADAAASLAHWELADDIDALPAALGGVSCLAWSSSQFDAPLLIVGGGGAGGTAGVLKVRGEWRAARRVIGFNIGFYMEAAPTPASPLSSLQIWGFSAPARKWLAMLELIGHAGRVHDVAWAPCVGRPFHLVASADAIGIVAVWRVEPAAAAAAASTAADVEGSAAAWRTERLGVAPTLQARVAGIFDDHGSQPVWRVEWSAAGTVRRRTCRPEASPPRASIVSRWSCRSG